MKKSLAALLALLMLTLAGCGGKTAKDSSEGAVYEDAVYITLGDKEITVDSKPVSGDAINGVYTANDIVYYETGRDFTYGEGTENDAHSAEEAADHTVLHITQSGTYCLSGTLSKGQIAVDLGKEAKKDQNAVVTLILNGVDISCEVAPAVIFYNVYECATAEEPSANVDTSSAGANVIIADGSENVINGAYVARIYKPESVVLTEDGTAVQDASKLHKYDGAFYSKMSMNISGGSENTGKLTINAQNEGLDSEMHLTVNGGNITILSGNDGINTNEDGVSVTTVNGGALDITVTGQTGEGDGIDSNGWLVINGGIVTARACAASEDAGIDSDMGIHINGGTVLATGHMLDRIEDGGQTYAVFSFGQKHSGEKLLTMDAQDGSAVFEYAPGNDFKVLIYSSPLLKEGSYSLYSDGEALSGAKGGGFAPGAMGMQPPEGMEPTEDMQPPEGMEPPAGMPEDMPSDEHRPMQGEPGEGMPRPGKPGQGAEQDAASSSQFQILEGANMFQNIK